MKNMIKNGISKAAAYSNVWWFDLMTVVKKDEVFDKCVPFIEYHILGKHETKLVEDGSYDAWNRFFTYLKRQWDNSHLISLFNYDGVTMDL